MSSLQESDNICPIPISKADTWNMNRQPHHVHLGVIDHSTHIKERSAPTMRTVRVEPTERAWAAAFAVGAGLRPGIETVPVMRLLAVGAG